jgi:DNA-binding CsgD family transcriptional regulator
VLIVDREAKLIFANGAGAQLLAARDGLRLDSGRLMTAHRDDQAALVALLQPLKADAPRMVVLRRPGNRRALLVQAVPLRSEGRWAEAGRMALLIEAEPPPAPSLDRLAAAYGLTRAEARLWSGLAAGATLSEIAARQRISINTLRVQLGKLFAKVGVHRQADLVRRALELGRPDGTAPS